MASVIIPCGDRFVVIDEKDCEVYLKYKWYINETPKHSGVFYVCANVKKENGKRTIMRLHRLLMNPPIGFVVDHIDGDGLNNSRSNLRLCKQKENVRNQRTNCKNTSGLKGVSWNKNRNKFESNIQIDRKRKFLGYFSSALEAHSAYCEASRKYHKEFGRTK